MDEEFLEREERALEKTARKKCGKRAVFGYFSLRVAKTVTRRFYLKVTLIQLIGQLIFQVLNVVYCFTLESDNAHQVNRLWYNALINTPFTGSLEEDILFNEISDIAEIWTYIKTVFIPVVAKTKHDRKTEPSADQFYQTNMLGTVRLRQLRVKADTCRIWEPAKTLTFPKVGVCYGPYTRHDETDEPVAGCEYRSESELSHLRILTELVRYSGGGYIYDLHQPLEETIEGQDNVIDKMRRERWINEATRAVFLHVLFYCGSVNKFTLVALLFELPPAGGVHKRVILRVQDLIYSRRFTVLLHVYEVIMACFALLIAAGIVVEAVYYKWRLFTSVWVYIDVCIVLLNVIEMVFDAQRMALLPALHADLQQESTYVNIEWIMSRITDKELALSVGVFFVFVRTYKYFSFNPTMAKLNRSIQKASGDILTFAFVAVINILAFANLAWIIFGYKIKQFSTLRLSVYNLLKMVFGKNDYSNFEDTERIFRMFYFVYVVVAVIVLFNILLGIISDAYTDKEERQSGTELGMWAYIKEVCHCRRTFKTKPERPEQDEDQVNVPKEQIREALVKLGFSELETEEFFDRFNIRDGAVLYDYDQDELESRIDEFKTERLTEQPSGGSSGLSLNYDEWLKEDITLENLERELRSAHALVDQRIEDARKHVANFVRVKS